MDRVKFIKFAYLEEKFWAPNSILVPENAPIVDERFHSIREIIKDQVQLDNFRIY